MNFNVIDGVTTLRQIVNRLLCYELCGCIWPSYSGGRVATMDPSVSLRIHSGGRVATAGFATQGVIYA